MTRLTARQRISRGFTLTEVLVAMAIFATIFVAALMIYDRSNKIFVNSMAASDLQQNTRVAFEKMVADIRMAGYDYNRDGTPSGANVYDQPDEQLEYIAEHAITIRANLDYETDAANDNGREQDYEPTTGEFPIVTTANDEIVTYALKSVSGSNSDSITFYADVAKPRASYPGGSSETLVTISGVDLCDDGAGCADPPYTLYRITLDDSASAVYTPLAENIRSLTLQYYNDALQLSEVTPNGGAGQYTVSGSGVTTSAAAEAERSLRESVQSIRMRLIGMDENADPNYVSPVENSLPTAEQIASAKKYRQYDLETTIVPRNLGRSGMEEIYTDPPGAPKVTAVCAEGCGVVRVEFEAPAEGSVDGYSIIYDTSVTGGFGSTSFDAGNNLYGYVYGLDPATDYYFKVVAKNSYGSQRSINTGGPVKPINYTKPDAPTAGSGSGESDGDPAAVDDVINLTWDLAKTVQGSNSCGDTVSTYGSFQEIESHSGFQIRRADTPFDDSGDIGTQGTLVFDGWIGDTGAPVVTTDYIATWTDDTAKVACQTYYYRVRVKEECVSTAAYNSSGDVNQSYSDWMAADMEGSATASAAPVTPTNLEITSTSTCTGGVSGTCNVNLLWDRVTKDANALDILVPTYKLKRIFYDAASGVEDPSHPYSTSTPISITDSTPSAGTQMNYTDTPPNPDPLAVGNRYHYYVAAEQCSSGTPLTSAYSSPAVKFPCVITQLTSSTPTPVDGTGLSVGSPYLMETSLGNASFELTATNKTIATASVNIYVGDTSTTVGGGSATVTTSTTATFTSPLNTTTVYRIEMTVLDPDGCGTTVTRYVKGTVSGCCLVPLQDVFGGTNDSTIISGTGGVIKVLFKNQCFESIQMDGYKLQWNPAASSLGNLIQISYPGGTTFTGSSGSGTIVVTWPGAEESKIAPGASIAVTFTFDKNKDYTGITGVCGKYTDSDGTADCGVKTAATCTVP